MPSAASQGERRDAAHDVLGNLNPAEGVGDAHYLARGDPREVHLQDRFLDVAGQPLVAFEELGAELLALPVARDLQALYLAGWRNQAAIVVAVALTAASGAELPVPGL